MISDIGYIVWDVRRDNSGRTFIVCDVQYDTRRHMGYRYESSDKITDICRMYYKKSKVIKGVEYTFY